MITIEFAQVNLSKEDFDSAYTLLINAYAITEVKIWGENYSRINKDEYRGLIAKEEIAFARINNRIVGCIHFHKHSYKTYTFGLLAVDFSEKGQGIGRELVNYVEKKAKTNGADTMTLVILRAENFDIDDKIILKNWYKRMGYQYVSTRTFLEVEPKRVEKAKKLITPVLFDAYTKILS